MPAYSFLRPQLTLLSGLSESHVRYLEKSNIITPINRKPITYDWQTVVICTIIKSLKELYEFKTRQNMILQLIKVFRCRDISQYDLYHFSSWKNYLIGYQKLEGNDWEKQRWVVRVVSGYDCQSPDTLKLCQRLDEVKLTASGDFETVRARDDTLVCIYIRGIFERLILAARPQPPLQRKIFALTKL